MSEFSHYGVLGMKWGVRKDRETSGPVKTDPSGKTAKQKADTPRKRINSDQIQADTKVAKNSDGSVTVTGLKEISEATFDSQESYKKWLDGNNNFYAQIEENLITTIGGTKVSEGSPTIKGVGYTLKFDNDADYREYTKQQEYVKFEMAMSYSNNAALYQKSMPLLKQYTSAEGLSPSRSDFFEAFVNTDQKSATQLYSYIQSAEVNGYEEYTKYTIETLEDLSDEERKQVLESFEEQMAAMKESFKDDPWYGLYSPEVQKQIQKEESSRLQSVKDEIFSMSIFSSGKEYLDSAIANLASSNQTSSASFGDKVKQGVSSVSSVLKDIGSNVCASITSLTSSLSDMFKKK